MRRYPCGAQEGDDLKVSDRGDGVAFEVITLSADGVVLDRKSVKKLRRDLKRWLKEQKERAR
jgi:hypothetical protein